jgi:DNA repair protein RecO (recombination protein O)
MDERSQGIVLRVHPLTETSLIVRWLTQDMGRVATVAKGARQPKSPLRGKLDLFYFADFTFRRSRRSELHALREVSLRETHTFLRRELGYLQQISYCAALIEQTTEIETPIPVVFDLLRSLLVVLGTRPPLPQTILAFEVKLLNELGLKPDLALSRLSSGSRDIMTALGVNDWPVILDQTLSHSEMIELQKFLHGFMIYHLGKIPKGRKILIIDPEKEGSLDGF